MIVRPDTFADRGCWISDDRVYAFVSSALSGIAEIGYHGAQPTSRNARVFVSESGAFRFAVLDESGKQYPLVFGEFDWMPGAIALNASSAIGSVRLQIRASGRSVGITFLDAEGGIRSFGVQFDRRSLFTDVHGQRSWTILPEKAGLARFSFRDQVHLSEWMKRGGPYGPDFLIPEPTRRMIYRRKVRSGLAVPADLLPEFQNSNLSIYDAEVQVSVGGEGFRTDVAGETLFFTRDLFGAPHSACSFVIAFDVGPEIVKEQASLGKPSKTRAVNASRSTVVPVVRLPGFPHIEQFFSTVPELVESCVVRDYGIPRATPGGYYWIWAWDAMVTALVSLRWGAVELARRTAEFVHAHRDAGSIPMRWTHTLEPLDTQPPGALETLLATLTYAVRRENEVNDSGGEFYPSLKQHLVAVARQCDRRGLFPNIGFYPDLPVRFGRTEESAVAMEVASFYAFCRVVENCSLHMGDEEGVKTARQMIGVLEKSYSQVFWDPTQQFYIDAMDRKSGLRNMSYPLFNLLFLHYPPAVHLIGDHVIEVARFIRKHHFAPVGIRVLPAWDRNADSETVSNSWYPHWDWYALKLLRQAGCSTEIMTWMRSVELALDRLGYAPEYLRLDPALATDPGSWLHHGAASNLNCATGWYEAILEGVFGLNFDPGGMAFVPLGLPLDALEISDVRHLGTSWSINVRHHGVWLQDLRVDGEMQQGSLKVPKRFHDGKEHQIELIYGDRVPGPQFSELANAEVLDVDAGARGIEISFNALGQVDLAFAAPSDWQLTVDGHHVGAVQSTSRGFSTASLQVAGHHTACISRRT
jgi:hypothetical protein